MTDDDRIRSFEALYRSTLPSVRAYARRRAPTDVAEDVVAQTYLTAWRRCDDAIAGGLPWLYRTAAHCLANHERTERRQWRVAQRVSATTDGTEADTAESSANRAALIGAIDRLGDADREVLLLVYWEHLNIKALAVTLGCRPGTAAVRLHRARRRLREALSDPPEPVRPTIRPPSHASEVTP